MQNRFEIPGIIVSRTCFLPMVTEASWQYIRLFEHYQNSLLPFSGGLYDQPNRYLQAMEIIERNQWRNRKQDLK